MILERGIVALDAKIFSEIVRKLPDNQITIETDENLVTTITCEKAKFNIPGQSGEDFSYLPILETSDCVSICLLYTSSASYCSSLIRPTR